MPTKSEMSEEVNNKLGTDYEWDRMLSDDLEDFHIMVMEGELVEELVKDMIAEQGKEMAKEQMDNWFPGKLIKEIL